MLTGLGISGSILLYPASPVQLKVLNPYTQQVLWADRRLIRGGEWTVDTGQKLSVGLLDLPHPFAMSAVSHLEG